MFYVDRENGEKILFETADILEEIGVPYHLTHGTLLGLYRDHAIIEGDSDMDIGILMEDFRPKLDDMIDEFSSNGFRVRPFSTPCSYIRTLWLYKYDTIMDIMGFFLYKDKRFCLSQEKENVAWLHSAEFFNNYTLIKFKGKEFPVPAKTEEFLKEAYGDTWQIPQDKKYVVTKVFDYWNKVKKEMGKTQFDF